MNTITPITDIIIDKSTQRLFAAASRSCNLRAYSLKLDVEAGIMYFKDKLSKDPSSGTRLGDEKELTRLEEILSNFGSHVVISEKKQVDLIVRDFNVDFFVNGEFLFFENCIDECDEDKPCGCGPGRGVCGGYCLITGGTLDRYTVQNYSKRPYDSSSCCCGYRRNRHLPPMLVDPSIEGYIDGSDRELEEELAFEKMYSFMNGKFSKEDMIELSSELSSKGFDNLRKFCTSNLPSSHCDGCCFLHEDQYSLVYNLQTMKPLTDYSADIGKTLLELNWDDWTIEKAGFPLVDAFFASLSGGGGGSDS
jgi:hypothetical protein